MRHFGLAKFEPGKTLVKHNKLNTFSVIAGCLFIALCQVGCVGLTGSNGSNPLAYTPALTVNPTSLSFGSVAVNGSANLNVTLTNSGKAALTITKATATGTGFALPGATLPISLAPGISQKLQVQFAPKAAGASYGALTITSNDPASLATVPLSGTGSGQALLSFTPDSVTFGNVSVGGSSSKTITISNGGSSPLNISSISAVGTGYSMSGMTAPVTINAGQSAPFTVKFAPNVTGKVVGGISVMSNAPNAPQTIGMTATGVIGSVLSANLSSVSFGSVTVGNSATQSLTLSNTGTESLTITQIATSSGFSASGINLPLTLALNQTVTFSIKYSPKAAGSGSGTLVITSNASNPALDVALAGTAVQAAAQITPNPSSLAFGNVAVGGSSSQSITLSNAGGSTLTITQITASGTGYSVSGFTLPVSIAAGSSSPITATFAPAAAGSPAGSISVTSNASSSPTNIAMTGTGIQSGITASPTTVAFGNVAVGSSGSQTVTLKNTGSSTLTISALTASGTGYSVSGFTLPISIAAGASSTITAKFAPTATGSPAGNISITSNAPGSPLTIAMTGTGVQGQVTSSPASVSFGNVLVGASSSQTVSLTNNGTASVTISSVAPTGTGYTITGLAATPITLTTGQSTSFTATFAPTSAASASGTITVTSNGSNPSLTISLSGTGVQAGISATPTSVAFGSVTVGSPNSQTIRINNTGSGTLTISQATVTGTGFSMTGLTVPATIAAGGNTTFNVAFAPNAAGTVNGSISLTNNSATSPLAIALSGTGVASSAILNSSASSLSFGSVNVGSSSTLSVTLTNTGNSSVTVSSVTVAGTGYTSSGITTTQVIAAGATATLSVQFTPTTATLVSGSVTVASNATNSPVVVTLSGTGVQAVQHSVALTWTASTSTVVGYNVYRSSTSGGPYTLLTSSPVAGTTYTDSTVQAGQTYYYVVTSVNSSNVESVYSNEASATVPTP